MKKGTAHQAAKLPVRPADKPIPKFRSHAAEERFWNSYELEVTVIAAMYYRSPGFVLLDSRMGWFAQVGLTWEP